MFGFSRAINTLNGASTELYNENTFYAAFSRDFKRAKKSIMIESPFVTVRRAKELAAICDKVLKRSVDIRIYTRNPLHHEGQLIDQADEGIRLLRQSGINVITCNDMRHRKIAIIDDEILWEGSLNMLSHSNSREVMRRTHSVEMCSAVKCFLN